MALVALLLSLACVAALGLVAPAQAGVEAARRAPKTRITAKVPAAAIAGRAFAVTGKIRPRSANRDVQVQIKRGKVWAILGRSRTSSSSTYAVSVTLPAGVSKLRVVARSKSARIGSTKPRNVAVAPDPDRGTRLTSGQALGVGQYLRSPGGRYRLVMQTDGNLVLLDGATPVWSTGGQSAGSRLIMQTDGNLVVLGAAGVGFTSGTAGFGASELLVQDDGNVVVYSQGLPTWSRSTGYAGDALFSGSKMQPGAERHSKSGRYRFVMQTDGNLVLYDGATATFQTMTSGANYAVMQVEGNLVVYPSAGGPAVYTTPTAGRNGAQLLVQDDGNTVIYQGPTAVWSTMGGAIG